jgi:hypothetical protein
MSLLGRLFHRPARDAMEIWLSETSATADARAPRWTAEPVFEHAPDLDPSEVPPGERRGMTGRPLPSPKGPITGLEGGGSPRGPLYGGS